MDFETALLSKEPNPILTQLLGQFILNLKPHTRNLSTDQISSTVASVLSEYFKSSERTIFWDEDLRANVDPFEGLDSGFFATDWDFKLKILRQLVELQLSHSSDIKATIDRAWGVVHNKHKKKDAATAPPSPDDPKSQERLQLTPIGQDSHRKRFWIADDSPRIYVSTNPWKTTATFQTISSTREEYVAVIENLKATAPPELKKKQKRSKLEQAHLALIATLENRIETIDAELVRVQKVQKKLEQRRLLLAQAEIRETRTRRKTQKPDYVYENDFDSEDDADEYRYQEEEVNDEEFDDEDFLNFREGTHGTKRRRIVSDGRRRSTRTAVVNGNGKREGSSDSWSWRGERRSSRLGAPLDHQFDVEPPHKRARTEESTTSATSLEVPITNGSTSHLKIKVSGAAALKPTEVAMEEIAGKKRSKFWVYAVEPIPGAADPAPPEPGSTNGVTPAGNNGNGLDVKSHDSTSPEIQGDSMDYERSLSPLNSA